MIKRLKGAIRCFFGLHDTIFRFSLPRCRENVFQCKRCKKYFVCNGLTHKQERVKIIWEKAT